MNWDLNYITYFQFEASNSGVSLSTWFGDFNIPMRTIVLLGLTVVVLRVRKKFLDKKKQKTT